jgi:hypothetical protein
MNYRIITIGGQKFVITPRLSSHELHPVGSGTLRNGGPMNYRIITITRSENWAEISTCESHPVGSGTLRNGGPMNYRIITIAQSEKTGLE